MMHLLRRQTEDAPGSAGDPSRHDLRSHILPRFLKRLRSIDRPYLLDLGPLSGGNIEFFARIGCRVQVEDLISAIDEARPEAGRPAKHARDRPPPSTPDPPGSPERAPAVDVAPGTPFARRGDARPPESMSRPGHQPGRPGRRPSRHIVLPPRTFPRAVNLTTPAMGASTARPDASATPPLPTVFDYPDETFHAIVAWDVFNFYDPASARRVASDARRILKPGGLILSLFHARTATGPERPHRYMILEETRLSSQEVPCRALPRQLFQNRDIEKMFAGMKIIELYFLQSAVREMLMEKKPPVTGAAASKPSRPLLRKPRFTIG